MNLFTRLLRFRRPLASFLCWAGFLAVGQTQTPATVTLGNLVQTYTGTPKTPTVTTTPADLPTQITYRNLSPTAPAPLSEIVYNDSPEPLPFRGYPSFAFQAQGRSALGDLIQLAGPARTLESCEVILVTWARAANYIAWATNNPAISNANGWSHPVTLSIYEVKSDNQLVFRSEVTQNILVPWRPLTKPDGSTYTDNGFAFRANFPFPNGMTLPERVLIMVSFNTQSSGFAPIGTAGPYNELNVAARTTSLVTPVGSDVNRDVVLQVLNGSWYYPSTGWTSNNGPMIRIRALTTESITPPVNAGNWQATARISNPSYLGSASNSFTIQPSPVTIEIGDLTQYIDGSPKPVTITTNPLNVAVNTTYDLSPTPPSALGTYAVQTQIAPDPNYLASSASGQLSLIGHSLASWLDPWVLNGGIPGSATGANDDPDQDTIPNLMEYALSLNPSTASHGLGNLGMPYVQNSPGQISLIYRKNVAAIDLNFQVESASELAGPETWLPAITTEEVLTTVGGVRTIRASMPISPGETGRFMRLKVTRPGAP